MVVERGKGAQFSEQIRRVGLQRLPWYDEGGLLTSGDFTSRMRRAYIRTSWARGTRVTGAHLAAIQIQRTWRGHLVRQSLRSLGLMEQKSEGHIQDRRQSTKDLSTDPTMTTDTSPASTIDIPSYGSEVPSIITEDVKESIEVTSEAAEESGGEVEGGQMKGSVKDLSVSHVTTKALTRGGNVVRSTLLTKYISQVELERSLLHPIAVEGLSIQNTPFNVWCAVRIQAVWRGHHSRVMQRRLQLYPNPVAAETIQWAWKRYQKTVLVPERNRQIAARLLQKWWRGRSLRLVFARLAALISFWDRGNPAAMLRSINPVEAKLLDVASGAHVRFRLSGTHWPPSVVYKVFTHRPVVDMGAFSPKYYAAIQDFGRVENPGLRQAIMAQWYKRVECNEWRPVTVGMRSRLSAKDDEKMSRFIPPQAFHATADEGESKPFHPLKWVRREDAIRMKKARRRAWMAKLYRDGRADLKPGLSLEGDGVEDGSAANGSWILDIDEEEEGDLAELLDWSSSLDFDAYSKEWTSLGTTDRFQELFMGSSDAAEAELMLDLQEEDMAILESYGVRLEPLDDTPLSTNRSVMPSNLSGVPSLPLSSSEGGDGRDWRSQSLPSQSRTTAPRSQEGLDTEEVAEEQSWTRSTPVSTHAVSSTGVTGRDEDVYSGPVPPTASPEREAVSEKARSPSLGGVSLDAVSMEAVPAEGIAIPGPAPTFDADDDEEEELGEGGDIQVDPKLLSQALKMPSLPRFDFYMGSGGASGARQE